MYWPYVAIASGTLGALSAFIVKLLLARRRRISARKTKKTLIEGMSEITCQSIFCLGLMLIGGTALHTIATAGARRLTLMLSITAAVILILCFGVQLGRLLMRYQLHRLRGVLDTVTGEIAPKIM